jgi:alkaline phosphatase
MFSVSRYQTKSPVSLTTRCVFFLLLLISNVSNVSIANASSVEALIKDKTLVNGKITKGREVKNKDDKNTEIKDRNVDKKTVEDFWYQQGKQWLQQKTTQLDKLNNTDIKTSAKNVIVFVGDGMSITTLTAARIWQGQQAGKLGEEHFLHFEQFPHTALIKTYNTNQQSPDSAGTMSAMMTGVKTRAGVIGIGPEQNKATCENSGQYHQKNLFEWGSEAGFSTGVVTTTRLTHATPAATYAHTPERNWEGDLLRYPNAYLHGCDSIAKQLIDNAFSIGLDIALGGGSLMLSSHYDRFKQQYSHGLLINSKDELLRLNALFTSASLSNTALISNTNAKSAAPVLGVFALNHMDYETDRIHQNNQQQPSLKQMAEQALKHLQRQNKPYLLVVEAGRIDHAHHDGNAARALSETAMLADTVERLDELTADEDTLIIVTADHSHNFVMAGYPKRGNPILGISKNQSNNVVLANDGLPYTTLGYANGDSFGRQVGDVEIQNIATQHVDYRQGVAVPLSSATHGGDDVALHAKGPGAYLFSGLMEQHEIFHTILQALQMPVNDKQTKRLHTSAKEL